MADYGVSANRLELLQIADAVAREKSIDRTIVVTAMEDAIALIEAHGLDAMKRMIAARAGW